MKKKLHILIFVLVLSGFGFFGQIATAANCSEKLDFTEKMRCVAGDMGINDAQTEVSGKALQDKIVYFVQVILSLVGVIVFGIILYAGYLWMMGDKFGDINKAKNLLRNSIIGLFIVLSAYVITSFIGSLIENFN